MKNSKMWPVVAAPDHNMYNNLNFTYMKEEEKKKISYEDLENVNGGGRRKIDP